ncbi:Molybdenum cofactor synthesis [Syntrophomonas zehnderi OL-4]|uniref:Molybdenum cofactor synthesis n=1 Tax=Syntrophomonas zehnderi OL-4 TaxID=690567 RepID=A0A0E4C9A5_9FIRM|nr:MogA/MoaB family molybdenum cofactor biosynthesis protein [Syntrophomonas zehnderi]CFX90729.1 Molybdenum cofactor synthesis [Syntrophomonas zehnderi OL-4]
MYKAGILILSDKGACGQREDLSGQQIKELLADKGFDFCFYEVIPDEKELIKEKLIMLCDKLKLDIIFTSGGTGFSHRDITPEATLEVVDKITPGIPEAIRYYGMQKTPKAMLSRAVAGIRSHTLIINLPGSVKGVRESLEAIMPALEHGLEILVGSAAECGQE